MWEMICAFIYLSK